MRSAQTRDVARLPGRDAAAFVIFVFLVGVVGGIRLDEEAAGDSEMRLAAAAPHDSDVPPSILCGY